MQKDSILNIILVGVGLCIVCGAVISTVAVSLRDQQEQNVIFDQQSKIIDAARLLEVYPSSQEALASIEEVVVNLNDGEPSSFQIIRQSVNTRNTYPMKSARYFIRIFIKFTSSVKNRHYNF